MPLDGSTYKTDAELVLGRAIELVNDGWTRRVYVRNSFLSGKKLYCVAGAIQQASHELNLDPVHAETALSYIIRNKGYVSLARWNDRQPWFVGKKNVIAGMQKAIKVQY